MSRNDRPARAQAMGAAGIATVLNHPFAGHAACRSLEDAGLVDRERDTTDRRSVTTRITSDGPLLLEALDEAAADAAPAGFSSIHSLNPMSRS